MTAKKILTGLLVAVVVVVAVFCIVAALQPDEFRISRSITINASANHVFPHVNNLQKWNDWSPWVALDPNATVTFEGPHQGVGAKMAWDGNRNVGAGSMTITESKRNELVQFHLEFLKPLAGTSTAEFTFVSPDKHTTNVTWAMFGHSNFMGKAMGLLVNCDKMMGEQFDKGLANLKSVSEK